jgi:hypothetical protein
VAGFPKGFNIFTCGTDRKRSAIIINNNHIDVIAITKASLEVAILAEFRYGGIKFYGASLFLPIDRDIDRDLGTIKEIILALDSNARSINWSDMYTNTRGRAMKE